MAYQQPLFEITDQKDFLPPFDPEAAARAEHPFVPKPLSAAALDHGNITEINTAVLAETVRSTALADARASLAEVHSESQQ